MEKEKRLRLIRFAVGTGITWAFVWSFVGSIFVGLFWVVGRASIMAPYFAVMGLIGGGAFSFGRRRFDEMSLPRLAAWGAVGGLLLGVLFGPETLVTLSIATLLGAGSAVGSLALARRPPKMSLPRLAAWGAVGGLLLSMPAWSTLWSISPPRFSLVVTAATVGVWALMWAGCAAGSLALARNAHDGDLLETGGSAGKIEGE